MIRCAGMWAHSMGTCARVSAAAEASAVRLWQGRFSGKPPDSGAILKDLDLDISLKLPEDWHAR